ncbi:MAG: hypothetical protein M3R24_22975 [Chloroflexota bacterium]|nr:hypothetical protein [Chloroflexota bacterium]PLS77393.1 MAG: hypothetical protein CYG59_24030 [Chloroflexota bacterium]
MSHLIPEVSDGRIDAFPVAQASLSDLNLERIKAHIANARERDKLDEDFTKADDIQIFLQRFGCVIWRNGEFVPTAAGILMFGHRPQFFFPHADVGLGHFPGTVPTTIDAFHLQRYGGVLTEQIDEVEKYLWQQTRRGFTVGEGARRVEQPEYPRAVIRELTVNAIAHRNYNISGQYIRVSMFADRIEWISPGGLPPGITLDNILHEQIARNPTIAELLWQAGYIERFGLGLDTCMQELRRAGLPELKLIDSGVSFTARIYNRHAPSIQVLTPFRVQLLEHAREKGYLTMEQARQINKQLPSTDQRSDNSLLNDIKALKDLGLLSQVGKGKNTAYVPVPEVQW